MHASEGTVGAMKAKFPHAALCCIPPFSTSFLQPSDLAVFRSFENCIQAQASATLARFALNGTFDDVVMNKAWRPNGPLGHSRTCARGTRRGQLAGIACVTTATISAPRPTSCTPLATCSRNRSNQSPLPKALWNGPWRKSRTKTTRQHRLDLT